MAEFQAGQRIRTASGGELRVIQKLGEGGQGIVYKVNYCGKEMALKWYFIHKLRNPDKFYKNLKRNIVMGAPTGTFLWPQEVTEYHEGSFGYLMELRPSEYKDFPQFLRGKVNFRGGWDAVIHAALCITNGFRDLHRMGVSYQDLNDGNFFVNPQTGDVLICDNDNVAPYGENLGIVGKCRYMAPEVVMGRKMPDIHTDRFSLAVVLYQLLCRDHPLEGKKIEERPCMTEELEQRLYGKEPVFVWDKSDNTNRPVSGVNLNEIKFWPVFPEFVKDAFQKAFSRESLVGEDTEHRFIEQEWQEVFIKLRDCLVDCPVCGNGTFIDEAQGICRCINCGRNIGKFPILKVKRYRVAIAPGKKVYACHTNYDSDDFKKVMGEVITGRDDPSLLGLKNGSDNIWTAVLPNGRTKQYAKGQTIGLARGMKVRFENGNEGEVL